MEEKFGGVSLYFNGPCADLAPGILKKDDGTSKIIGGHIADVAIKALEKKDFEKLEIANDKIIVVDGEGFTVHAHLFQVVWFSNGYYGRYLALRVFLL